MDIAKEFGDIHPCVISRQLTKIVKSIETDSKLKNEIEKIRKIYEVKDEKARSKV